MKLIFRLVALCAALALVGVAGFAIFLRAAMREPPPPPPSDGIVVLTGGAGRVEAALRLLAAGRARVALVSGVGGAAEFTELARLAGVDPGLGERVTLGRAARSTHGNAAETAAWARAQGVRSLIVVTAFYHMPRALAELGRTLPEMALHPVPVTPPALREGREAAMWRLLLAEYGKWLAAELDLTGFAADLPSRAGSGRAAEQHG
jgi:uncharacterized SAM-binding protein YcdF (DUF218 family)